MNESTKLTRGGFNEPASKSYDEQVEPLISIPVESQGVYIRDQTQIKLDKIIEQLKTLNGNMSSLVSVMNRRH